ncbi:MAG: alkaline phosphatase D family protein, partial [Planctomycetota bacterium]
AGCRSGGLSFDESFGPVRRGADETVLAFGSCLRTTRPAPLLDEIAAVEPDALILLGDNVYVTGHRRSASAGGFDKAYGRLAKMPSWQRLRAAAPRLLATWDDHDYGRNDAGASWRLKDEAKEAFLRFFEIPTDSPIRERGGVYHAAAWGEPGRRVQVLLLDTRWFRDRLRARATGLIGRGGPYLPTADTSRTLLGEAQWAWLEEKLREPADVRVIASSIQVLAGGHGWETWANFPHERQRLFELITQTNARG